LAANDSADVTSSSADAVRRGFVSSTPTTFSPLEPRVFLKVLALARR
jgi:hypothetical protein